MSFCVSKVFHVFDIWSDFACFKKNYATSSPQTFCFPPPSAIMGFCGCIVGDKWADFVKRYVSEIELGIQPQFDGQSGFAKIRMGMKLLITKDVWNQAVYEGRKPFVSSPVPFELLYNPKYRVYLHCDSLRERLGEMLRAHHSYFTPYLGMAQFIANFRYLGEFQFEEKNEGAALLKCVFIPPDKSEWSLDNSSSALYAQERYPLLRSTNSDDPSLPERDVERYVDCIVPLGKSPIKIMKGNYYSGDLNGISASFSTIPV
ncbi:MAG: CRISPR-associated protein Cas5 [Nitrososphaerales archaeon]